MAIIYDLLELNGLPSVGDVVGVPGSGADIEFLMSETTAEVADSYFSTNLGSTVTAGFYEGSNGTFPADIDGTSYSTNGLYETNYSLGGNTYSGFIVQAVPVGGGPLRYFFIPEDNTDPVSINTLTIQSMTSVVFIDAASAATDDSITFAVCFVEGTRLNTPNGLCKVEDLKKGDLVTTADRGNQPVLWVSKTLVTVPEVRANAKLNAVEISAGAFAEGIPACDVRVSRQHRLLVKSRVAERMFGSAEVLVAAKELLDWPGVQMVDHQSDFWFIHILLPCHSLLVADGIVAESLWIGEEAERMLGGAAIREARRTLFAKQTPACQLVSGRRARNLVARHRRNGQPLVNASRGPIQVTDS